VSFLSGKLLGPYEIVSPLGAGGMGEVYRARDTRLGREVAVKVLQAQFTADPERLHRFEQEARAAAALNHPNILVLHDMGTHEGAPYIVTELLEGETLRQRLREGSIPPAKVVALGVQIAQGLAAAHEKGIIHRDMKPENLFITGDGRVKILDFGLARLRREGLMPDEVLTEAPTVDTPTREGSVLGTVGYMSPEQAQGKPVDARSDVFSLGIVLYEMVTGRRPFEGDTNISVISSILRDTPAPITETQPLAPARLDQMVTRCLEKDPGARYPDASTLRDDLADLGAELSSDARKYVVRRTPARGRLLAAGLITAILAAVAVLFGIRWHLQSERERWVRQEALPKLEAIVDRIQRGWEGREAWDAFVLAKQIDAVAPGNPLVERLRPKFTTEAWIVSDPPGAEVHARYYDDPDAEPLSVGKTPLEHVPYPRGYTRIQLNLPGQSPIDDVFGYWAFMGRKTSYKLPAPGEVPEGMSLVPGGEFEVVLSGIRATETTADFAMDRHEVTNRDFKRFVDAGGYTDPKYWCQPFLDGGRELTLKEALARFTDRTGRPGPAVWEVGSYPKGQDEYPVSGVSWYEAAAYAEWTGKSLPTIFHWNQVAFTLASARIVPPANLNGSGPVPVGSTKSANRFGVSDLAGNVREWAWNASDGGQERLILGGGWNDPDYAFGDSFAQPAFDRSPTNGFRCIRYLKEEPRLASIQRPIKRQMRDFRAEKPVSDAVFAQYLRQFAYDRTPLDARIEEEETTPTGVRQKISFNAAYGGERMMAYLFLPVSEKPPYQVVVFFPGSAVINLRSSKSLDLGVVDFLPKSGRAVLYPIYKGTFERSDDLADDLPHDTALYKDHVIMWAKDLARSIDYLETRKDIDAGRLAFYGFSWGGRMGSTMPALEKRIKVNVLYVAGFSFQHAFPEVDEINYVSRVKQPTLMLNGDLDYYFPRETSQRPMFELLGTPAADKKWLLFPGGHSVPRTEMIKESLAWLDRYLGPVRS
jgi:dienelactone hydrolase